MKSTKSMIVIGAIVLVVLAELYYCFTYYKQDRDQIVANKREIESVDISIAQLEERLKRHEESKKELERLQIEKTAIEDKIPLNQTKSKFESDLINYLKVRVFTEGSIEHTTETVVSTTLGEILKAQYTISLVQPYEDSRALVEELTNMYQTCNIISYEFDTSVQQVKDEEKDKYLFLFGDDFYSLGEMTVVFDVYYRSDNAIIDEFYQPDASTKISTSPFRNDVVEVDTEEGEVTVPSENASTSDDDLTDYMASSDFLLNIGDALSSGDVYKLSGPGATADSYIGLSTTSNVDITVTINKDSYELDITDSEGHTKHTRVDYSITNPTFRIISGMHQLETVMPNVHVYIQNNIGSTAKVWLTGSLLENIHIYNGDNQEVQKGQTKGNVSLT